MQRFLPACDRKHPKRGGTKARKGPGLPPQGYSPGDAENGLLPFLSGEYGVIFTVIRNDPGSMVFRGRDSRGIYLPSARISRTESCRIKEELPCPAGRPDPEFPGGNAG